jgi:hypothetical protein
MVTATASTSVSRVSFFPSCRAFLLILWDGNDLRLPFSSQENGTNRFGFGIDLQEKCSRATANNRNRESNLK